MEQEEYTKEEINWSYIEFIDNQDVLDLIEKVAFLALNIYISRTLWYGYAKTNLDENKIALSLSLSDEFMWSRSKSSLHNFTKYNRRCNRPCK